MISHRSSLLNAIIDGVNSKILKVASVYGADNSTQKTIINCPNGRNDTECIIVARAWRGYEFATINAFNTHKLTSM